MKEIKGRIGKVKKIKIDEIHQLKKILISFYKKNGKIPGLAYVKKQTKFEKEKIYDIMRYLKKEEFLVIEDNKLIINPAIPLNNPKRKKEIKKSCFNTDEIKAQAKKLLAIKNKVLPEKTSDKINSNNWITALRYILLIIGIGAVYMSIYYSDNWLREFLNPFRSLLLASIMVAFAVSAFELIILFFQRKKYLLICVFSLLWLAVTVFSMVSTVAGQYNARIEKINERYKQEKVIVDANRKYREYQEQKEEYRERKKILADDIRQLQNILSQYITKEMIEKNKKQYNIFRWRFYQAKKEMKIISNKLVKLRKSTDITTAKKNPPDFYIWISGITGFGPDMIQFWLSVFPAIFIDLIAPFSFAIVMFVRKEKT